jgi:hypothetical protein
MKSDKRTIQSQSGCVVVHAALPAPLLKWAVKRAKDEGHKDISLVMQRGIDCLIERHKAESASA